MNKKSIKPSFIKALGTKIGVGVAILALGAATVFGVKYYDVSGDNAQLQEDLVKINANLEAVNINLSSLQVDNEQLVADLVFANNTLSNYSTTIDTLNTSNNEILLDYAELEAELELEREQAIAAGMEFEGFSEEFNLGASISLDLNDNQFEKLGDYEVEFDGEDIDVKEFLLINGVFNLEDEVSLNFNDNDVKYKITFDEVNFAEDSLEISVLDTPMEITNITSGVMSIDASTEYTLTEGEVAEGLTLSRIGENAVLVSFDGETKSISEGDSYDFGDLEVEVDSIFYIDNADDNIAVLRVSEDLDTTIEVGDFVDEAELWKYTSIENNSIVISLDDKVEEVSELVLPNDFATLSMELTDVDYQNIEVEKEDGVITKVSFDLEDFDSTYAEYNGTTWEAEDEDELIDFTAMELKDSDFSLKLQNNGVVKVFDAVDTRVVVKSDEIKVDGSTGFDNDENIYNVNGIIVAPTEDFVDEEDESIVISVPEETVKAELRVQ